MLLAPKLAIGEIAPDFTLLLVAYFAINRPPIHGAVAGFLVGLLQDLFNPELLGVNALAKSITGYGLSVAAAKAEPESHIFLGGLLLASALAHDFIYLLVFSGLNLWKLLILWVTVALPSAVYTAIVGVIIHIVSVYLGNRVVQTFGKARS